MSLLLGELSEGRVWKWSKFRSEPFFSYRKIFTWQTEDTLNPLMCFPLLPGSWVWVQLRGIVLRQSRASMLLIEEPPCLEVHLKTAGAWIPKLNWKKVRRRVNFQRKKDNRQIPGLCLGLRQYSELYILEVSPFLPPLVHMDFYLNFISFAFHTRVFFRIYFCRLPANIRQKTLFSCEA